MVLDREREDSFVARLLDAKEFRVRMEAQMVVTTIHHVSISLKIVVL